MWFNSIFNEVFHPTGLTCCTDGGDIHARYHPNRCRGGCGAPKRKILPNFYRGSLVQRVSGPEIVIVKGNAFCDMFFCRHIRQLLLILLFCGYCTVNVNFLVNHSMVQKESQFISEVQSTSEQWRNLWHCQPLSDTAKWRDWMKLNSPMMDIALHCIMMDMFFTFNSCDRCLSRAVQ